MKLNRNTWFSSKASDTSTSTREGKSRVPTSNMACSWSSCCWRISRCLCSSSSWRRIYSCQSDVSTVRLGSASKTARLDIPAWSKLQKNKTHFPFNSLVHLSVQDSPVGENKYIEEAHKPNSRIYSSTVEMTTHLKFWGLSLLLSGFNSNLSSLKTSRL